MQKILLSFCYCLFVTLTWSQITIGTDSLNFELPVSPYDNFSYSQVIYPYSAINSTGTITGLKYKKTGTVLNSSDHWTIYIGHATKTAYTSTTSWIPTSAMTQVFLGTVVQVGQEVEITLDTPFAYNGIDNLVIAIDENIPASTTSNGGHFYCSRSYSNLKTSIRYNGSSNANPNSPPQADYISAALANVTLLGLTPHSCSPLDGLIATQIAGDQATISWNGDAGSTVEINYGTVGHVVGSGSSQLVTGTTTQLTGLSELTPYYVYIRTICGPGDTSVWVGPHYFETPCYNQTPPYLQDFNNYSPVQECWTEKRGNLSPTITVFNDNYSLWGPKSFGNYTSTYSAGVDMKNSNKEWLISPTIDLGNGSVNYQLELDLALTQKTSTNESTLGADDSLALVISTDNGNTWNQAGILKLWTAGLEPPAMGEHYVIDLSAYTGLVKFGLYAGNLNGTSGNGLITVDDFLVHEVPTCAQPTGISVGNVTSGSADITWSSSASHSIVEFGPKGFTLGTGTRLVSTSGSITLSNLLGYTYYDVFVMDSCAVADVSLATGPYYFRTLCSFYAPPYLEDFTGVTFDCWTENSGVLASDSTVFSNTPGPWTYGGFANNGFSGASKINMNNQGLDSWHISPLIDLGNGSKPYQLEFDMALTTLSGSGGSSFNSDDSLFLLISPDGGLTWNRSTILQFWTVGSEPSRLGDHFIVDLSAYTGMVQFAFYASSTITNGDKAITIDNFEIPSCARPNNVQATALDAYTVDLSWTQVAPDAHIEYGLAGFTQGTGTIVQSNTGSASISGLNSNTEYEFYVRDSCGTNDLSPWVGPILVRTFCPIYPIPFVENFDSYLPECWEEKQGILDSVNTIFTDEFSPLWKELGFANQGFTGSAGVNIVGQYGAHWLITPSIDLGDGSTPLQVQFNIASTAWANSDYEVWGSDDSLVLVVSTDNGQTWKQSNKMYTWTSNNIPSTTGDFFLYELTGLTGIVKFGLYAATPIEGNNFNVYIDEFKVVPVPTCQQPLNVKVNNITSSQATLSWTSGTAKITVEYGPLGFVLGTGTQLNTSNNVMAINGLTANTSYEIYVMDSCGVGSLSPWSGPVQFKTLCENTVPEYLEEFSVYPPPCWSEFKGKLESNALITNPYSSLWTEDGFGNVGSTGSARINIYSPASNGERYEWLVSPSIDLGNGSSSYLLEFDLALSNYLNTSSVTFDADDSLCLVISTDNGLTWSNQNVLRVWKMGSEPSNTGDFISQGLTGYKGLVKFAFYASTTKSGKNVNAYVDNFHVTTCTPSQHTINPKVCGTYTSPSGKKFSVSGQYSDTIPNAFACDSIITINLTVGQVSSNTLSETSCKSYTSNAGNTYTSSGTFTETFQNAAGCDSVLTLELTIIQPDLSVTNNDPILIANASNATYVWLDCNNNMAPIVGETSADFTAIENGSYAVVVTSNACSDTSSCFEISSIVGLNELAELGFRLLPNPTTDQFTIRMPNNLNVESLELLSSQGKLLLTIPIEKGQLEKSIQLSPYQSGVYFVRLKVNGEAYLEKVIKL